MNIEKKVEYEYDSYDNLINETTFILIRNTLIPYSGIFYKIEYDN